MNDHTCFGCGNQIASGQPHIHFTLDEWAEREGEESLGMGDFLTLAFCEPCTYKSDRGWTPEVHEIEGA